MQLTNCADSRPPVTKYVSLMSDARWTTSEHQVWGHDTVKEDNAQYYIATASEIQF